jgi:hypothetical protein
MSVRSAGFGSLGRGREWSRDGNCTGTRPDVRYFGYRVIEGSKSVTVFEILLVQSFNICSARQRYYCNAGKSSTVCMAIYMVVLKLHSDAKVP